MKRDMHENSLKAYREGRISLSKRATAIFEIYHNRPLTCFSDRDILRCLEDRSGQSLDMNYARPRITELRDMGLIGEVGSTTDLTTGKTVRLTRLRYTAIPTQRELNL